MRAITKLWICAATIVASSVTTPAFAQLTGTTVLCFRNNVACSTSNGTGSSAVVGGGVEFDRSTSMYDFTNTGLVVTLNNTPGVSFSSPLVYSFSDTTNPFTGFSDLQINGQTTFTADKVSFLNGVISFNIGGTSSTATTVSLALSSVAGPTTAVPELATWAMMIFGMGMVGGVLRRRVRASEVKFDAKIKRITSGKAVA